jgi:hypothetical protein
MNRIPMNYTSTDQVMIINPDGSVSYEPNVRYQQPTIIRRSYRTPPKPKYHYMIEQVKLTNIFLSMFVIFDRKESHIVVANGVDIGVHVNVLYVIFVIEY